MKSSRMKSSRMRTREEGTPEVRPCLTKPRRIALREASDDVQPSEQIILRLMCWRWAEWELDLTRRELNVSAFGGAMLSVDQESLSCEQALFGIASTSQAASNARINPLERTKLVEFPRASVR